MHTWTLVQLVRALPACSPRAASSSIPPPPFPPSIPPPPLAPSIPPLPFLHLEDEQGRGFKTSGRCHQPPVVCFGLLSVTIIAEYCKFHKYQNLHFLICTFWISVNVSKGHENCISFPNSRLLEKIQVCSDFDQWCVVVCDPESSSKVPLCR